MSKGINVRRKNHRRKPYRKSRAFDSSCRCHGGCRWCMLGRLHKHLRKMEPR